MTGSSLFAGCVALLLSLILTPLVRQACVRLRLFDLPGPLKIHSQPVPRLGGIAIGVAFVAGIFLGSGHAGISAWPFFMALFLIWLGGLVDDLRGLSSYIRLLVQFLAAAVLFCGGWRIPWFDSGPFSLIATSLFVIFFVNAFNFLDGADGLAAGVSSVTSLGYLTLPAGCLSPLGVAVASSLLGACAGFLAFNFPPAKIFMGDSGSTTLGFAFALLGLDFYRTGSAGNSVMVFPVIVAAIPLLDAVFAIGRRLQNRGSPFHGDREHFYDLLLARGWSPRNLVFVCYAFTAALTFVGRLSTTTNAARVFLICIVCYGGLLAAGLKLGSLRLRARGSAARHLGT